MIEKEKVRVTRIERGEGAPIKMIMIDGNGLRIDILVPPRRRNEFRDVVDGETHYLFTLTPVSKEN